MIHEPISVTVSWLRDVLDTSMVPTVTSMLDSRDAIPAVIVQRHTGGPLIDASGLDTAYDWTVTVYVQAGRTGPGNDLPDSQAAHQIAAAIVEACRANVTGRFATDDAQIVNVTVLTYARGVDENGNARATLTLQLRIQE